MITEVICWAAEGDEAAQAARVRRTDISEFIGQELIAQLNSNAIKH